MWIKIAIIIYNKIFLMVLQVFYNVQKTRLEDNRSSKTGDICLLMGTD
jgi:hypothetical protein